jgi:hypothetical protein
VQGVLVDAIIFMFIPAGALAVAAFFTLDDVARSMRVVDNRGANVGMVKAIDH